MIGLLSNRAKTINRSVHQEDKRPDVRIRWITLCVLTVLAYLFAIHNTSALSALVSVTSISATLDVPVVCLWFLLSGPQWPLSRERVIYWLPPRAHSLSASPYFPFCVPLSLNVFSVFYSRYFLQLLSYCNSQSMLHSCITAGYK